MAGGRFDPGPDPDEDGDPVEATDPGGHDAAWQAIVANFGERARLDDEAGPGPVGEEDPPARPGGDRGRDQGRDEGRDERLRRLFEPLDRAAGHPRADRGDASEPAPPASGPDEAVGGEEEDLARAADAPFVPPVPPAVPRARMDRRAAWAGAVGAPALLTVSLLLGLAVPRVVALLLVAAFAGGFCYLVLTMSREPRDPGDDGARV